jgi:hypothetical protein
MVSTLGQLLAVGGNPHKLAAYDLAEKVSKMDAGPILSVMNTLNGKGKFNKAAWFALASHAKENGFNLALIGDGEVRTYFTDAGDAIVKTNKGDFENVKLIPDPHHKPPTSMTPQEVESNVLSMAKKASINVDGMKGFTTGSTAYRFFKKPKKSDESDVGVEFDTSPTSASYVMATIQNMSVPLDSATMESDIQTDIQNAIQNGYFVLSWSYLY